MAALSINKVFQFIQFVANKENRGWISPEEFNLAAEVAQLTLYGELEGSYKDTKKIDALLRPFVATTPALVAGKNDLSSDFRIPINSWVSDAEGHPLQYIPVKEIDMAEVPYVYHSEIVSPSINYPVIFIDYDSDSEVPSAVIYPEYFPYNITIKYLKEPSAPEWTYATTNGRPVYNDLGTDFTFDNTTFIDISKRILVHVGINIGDELVAQYAGSQ